MANNIIFSSLAQTELEESYDWYEDKSVGLGGRFADVIYQSAQKIAKHPLFYPLKQVLSVSLLLINSLSLSFMNM